MENIKTYHCLEIKLGDIPAYAFMMDVKSLTEIQYIARRGVTDEPGAVQRVLSPVRVNAIYEYILSGNIFYTPFILNWNNEIQRVMIDGDGFKVPICGKSAQVLDGQHRIAGLIRAIEKKPDVGNKEVLVIMTQYLDTKDAAKVFLNINTEQKPVQKSLIYDLFGEVNQDETKKPIVRSKDIAEKLDQEEDSPYRNYIKFPGKKRGMIGIDLSTVVSSIGPKVEKNSLLIQYNINSLENQYLVFKNYFTAIKSYYDKVNLWDNSKVNPFLTNAGFYGAIEAFDMVFQRCVLEKDFSVESFARKMPLLSLLQRSDMKNYEGKEQRKVVSNFLQTAVINSDAVTEDGYKF